MKQGTTRGSRQCPPIGYPKEMILFRERFSEAVHIMLERERLCRS